MTDWADEIVAEICAAQNMSARKCLEFSMPLAAALRKAKADGVREAAAEANRDRDENGSVMIRPYHEIAEAINELAAKIERGEA